MLGNKHLQLFHECYSEEDVLSFLRKGMIQLWTWEDAESITAVMVTEICQTPRKRWVVIQALVGTIREARGEWEYILNWAKLNRCEEVVAFCRDSMCRFLQPLGFKKTLTRLVLEVGHV